MGGSSVDTGWIPEVVRLDIGPTPQTTVTERSKVTE
jgi:hypothetical protein